jgi:hypothetical protein
MKSKDLRIGNHVYIDDKEVPVTAADLLTLSQHERFVMEKELMTPVYISESVLFRLGFKVEFDKAPLRVYSLNEFLLTSNSLHTFNLYVGQAAVGHSIAYLHQLQNLFFDLTGIELIKE